MSIQDYNGFKLKSKEEKRLNRILKNYLKYNLFEIKPNPSDSDLNNIGYKLLRSPHYSDENWSWLHWQPSYQRPYSIMIDEYILFLYFKTSHLKNMVLDFYDSEKLKQKAQFNIPTENEMIFSIPHKEYLKIVRNIRDYGVKVVVNELDTNLDKIHQRLGAKGKMNQKLKSEIKRKIANSEVALGKKLTIKNKAEIIMEVMSRCVNT